VLLFKAYQEPKSMQGIAMQYPVAVEARDKVLLKVTDHPLVYINKKKSISISPFIRKSCCSSFSE
jgi:hypothetical protein